ncbi:MAG: hypothetical protein RLZZ414_2020 [Bacteroidota bacterium]|jgi:hypothetical protein
MEIDIKKELENKLPDVFNPINSYLKTDRRISFNIDSFNVYGHKSHLALLAYFCICMNYNKDLLDYSRIDEKIMADILNSFLPENQKYHTGNLRKKVPLWDMEQFKEYTSKILIYLVAVGYSDADAKSIIINGKDSVINSFLTKSSNNSSSSFKKSFDEFKKLVNDFYDEYESHKLANTLFDNVWLDIFFLLKKPVTLTRTGVGFHGEDFIRYQNFYILNTLEKSSYKIQGKKGAKRESLVYKHSEEFSIGLKKIFHIVPASKIVKSLLSADHSVASLYLYLLELSETCLNKNEEGKPRFDDLILVANIKRDLNNEGANRKNKVDLIKKLNKVLEIDTFFVLTWDKYQPIFKFIKIEDREIAKKIINIRLRVLEYAKSKELKNLDEIILSGDCKKYFLGILSGQFFNNAIIDSNLLASINGSKIFENTVRYIGITKLIPLYKF